MGTLESEFKRRAKDCRIFETATIMTALFTTKLEYAETTEEKMNCFEDFNNLFNTPIFEINEVEKIVDSLNDEQDLDDFSTHLNLIMINVIKSIYVNDRKNFERVYELTIDSIPEKARNCSMHTRVMKHIIENGLFKD